MAIKSLEDLLKTSKAPSWVQMILVLFTGQEAYRRALNFCNRIDMVKGYEAIGQFDNLVTISISGDPGERRNWQVLLIHEALLKTHNWEVCGPQCLGSTNLPKHYKTLTVSRFGAKREWVCTEVECRKKNGTQVSEKTRYIMSWTEFLDAVTEARRAEQRVAIDTETIGLSPEGLRTFAKTGLNYGMKPERLAELTGISQDKAYEMLDKWKETTPMIPPPPQLKLRDPVVYNPTYDRKVIAEQERSRWNRPVQGSAAEVEKVMRSDGSWVDTPESLKEAVTTETYDKVRSALLDKASELDKALEKTRLLTNLLDRARKDLQEWENSKVIPPGLFKAFDRAFRFMAGLNLQDHSIDEQKEYLNVMRDLKKQMNSFKEEFEGDTYNDWLKKN